ncbi:hypothetical protein TorRG33x02_237100 [Trema orientale]|uniref:Transmembrane protein n=1 Tax=Trema orientale TaxID=63057 RepID=A0A2P5E016_TREOI|nr:hypothetical protein TorRG33x02_237100 [Trema orientale]
MKKTLLLLSFLVMILPSNSNHSGRRRRRRRRRLSRRRRSRSSRHQRQGAFTPSPPYRVGNVFGLGQAMGALALLLAGTVQSAAAVAVVRTALNGGVTARDAALVDAP